MVDRQPAEPRRARSRRAAPTEPAAAPLSGLDALAAERLAIEGVSHEIDGGRFPAKAVAGRPFTLEADIFSDGHDNIDAAIQIGRRGGAGDEHPMEFVINDRWQVELTLPEAGDYEFTLIAWRDLFATWRKEVTKKHAAGQDIALELEEGRQLLDAALKEGRASREEKERLKALLKEDKGLMKPAGPDSNAARFARLGAPEVLELMIRVGPRTNLTRYKTLPLHVDREAAEFSAWYELMPRSQSGDPARHGTFDDVIARLPYVRDLGFDVLYFPPIHPIGKTNRKGRNNSLTADRGRSRQPLRHRLGGGRPRRHPSRTGQLRRLQAPCGRREGAWAGDRAGLRHPVLARPSVDQGASGMVRLAP